MSDTTPAKRPANKIATAVSNLTMGSADDALTVAKELQAFVQANNLTSTIQGKQFPNVEAWQFAGTLLGLSPMLESIEDKSTANEIKWNAIVAIQNVKTGAVVGRGFATCSNKEYSKKSFADYAIASMAQTRAVGKAYRLSLGWLMKAAGYEATPLEEMQDTHQPTQAEPETSATVVQDAPPLQLTPPSADDYRAALEATTSTAELKEVWGKIPGSIAKGLESVKNSQKQLIDDTVAADRAGMTLEQYRAQPVAA